MRRAPTYTSWRITCQSPDEAEALRRSLSPRIGLDREFDDTLRVIPGGAEQVHRETHRLGDYFSEIRVLPDSSFASTFRLIFERRNDAGRYWKDLMANILQEVESAPQNASIDLESKGDTEPAGFHCE